MSRLPPRLEALRALIPPGHAVVDVGADHGILSRSIENAVSTEVSPSQARAPGLTWVVAEGLRPFRAVECAVIAGMGAKTIAKILEEGPRPAILVLHAQDDPPALRAYLAGAGWRIEAESLAPEAGKYAELLRAVPGVESSSGLWLHFGPRLLTEGHPLLRAHLEITLARHRALLQAMQGRNPAREAIFEARVAFLSARLAEPSPPDATVQSENRR